MKFLLISALKDGEVFVTGTPKQYEQNKIVDKFMTKRYVQFIMD